MVSAKRKIGFYEKYIKRLFDIVCSLLGNNVITAH